MATITFDKVSRRYPGADRLAVNSFDLEIADGEFLVLVGPSGCGKSTCLRMLAGLEHVSSGAIRIGARDVTHVPPKERDIAMVFQNYALYPHLSVAQNMGFALTIAKVPKDEIERRVNEAAKILDLEPFLDRKPKALSGGQRQRVAMGRAIVRQPQVFLMDEPLSNLDAKLRVQTRTQIASLQTRLGVTTVYVTHDQVEAMTMGDRVAVMENGVLQQVGTPLDLYEMPANTFVAGFIGSPAMNMGTFAVTDGGALVGNAVVPLSRGTLSEVPAGGQVLLGFRPETVELVTEGTPGAFPVRVRLVEALGSDAFVYGEPARDGGPGMGAITSDQVIARVEPHSPPKKGETVWLKIRPGSEHVFSTETGKRLSS
ncbi:ABC transporter ATP-binding protein [Cellulomonas sp. Leaf395]|uniref:ABC transporter ATP-binding protein n=1 Tax=Cellulomonas sp. Leaf395 TaxID=1736362 RepID=UPI0006FBEA51|nr:sn-glycerol-3-phosphate ABC transporter ATP-binding protein UgpC [Cellulomonas sp. Leaf395]KQS97348.1 sugar ABC transporter ATP-binding protein [Cellulomonas sp. Leaf395]